MNLIDQKVIHSRFGEGIIVEQNDTQVSVKFVTRATPMKFSYPSCFKSFLKLVDAEVSKQIDGEVKKHEAVEEKKHQEAEAKAAAWIVSNHSKGSSRSEKTVSVSAFESVDSFFDSYRNSLIAEITYLRTTGGKKQRIFDGKRVEIRNNRYVYTFEADTELNYPDGTQITVWLGQADYGGAILGCEDFTITIVTEANLGDDVPLAEFSAEPWRLLNSLIDRLEKLKEAPSEIVRMLVCDGPRSLDLRNSNITTGQETAVQMAQNQPITFVWGPPGTGKTQTLAKIALAHMRQGHRVLMLSYSNVSVDGAIMRTHELSKNNKPGRLVRYGYARRKDLLEHDYLTSYNLAIRNHPELLHERENLIRERKVTRRDSARYVQIGRRLTEIRKALTDEEKHSVRSAEFVATTVSKAVVDSVVYENKFDVVIFDEASMAYIPQIVFSASLARKNFICMGDFRQLPPIVQSSNASTLNADIFQYCGISTAVDSGRSHKWLCMLDTQYRMHPDIADFSSRYMYNSLLKSADGMTRNRQAIIQEKPFVGKAIGFADLSRMMSVCTKTADSSRINVLSALISFSLALVSAKKHEVGIITPYHAQSRLLYAMARDTAEANPALKPISCATVHQFQGSEKDAIIYDAVDCYRMQYPGILLSSTTNNYANRLFNVAVTRAKGKFIGVGNIDYMVAKKLSPKLMFEKLIAAQRSNVECLYGQRLLSHSGSMDNTLLHFFDSRSGIHQYLKDIEAAKREVRIDIPDQAAANESIELLAAALNKAKRGGVKVYIRAENKATLPVQLLSFAIENTFVSNPVSVIDKEVVWFGMPESNAQFRTEGKLLPTTYRPIIRFKGKYTAASLYGFLEMSKTSDHSRTVIKDSSGKALTDSFSSYVLAHKTCNVCGKPMTLQKSKNGKFYLGCSAYPGCKNTSLVDVDLVDEYLYRNNRTAQRCFSCNCSLEAKIGRFGCYVQCCGLKVHTFKLDEI